MYFYKRLIFSTTALLALACLAQAIEEQIFTYTKIDVENEKWKNSTQICGNLQPAMDNLTLFYSYKNFIKFTVNYSLSSHDVCSMKTDHDFKGQLVLVPPNEHKPGTFSFNFFVFRCAKNAQRQNAGAILFMVDNLYSTFYVPDLGNDTSINLTILYTNSQNFNLIQSMFVNNSDDKENNSTGVVITLKVHITQIPIVHGSMILIFFMTLFCVILGGWWSGKNKKQLWLSSLGKSDSGTKGDITCSKNTEEIVNSVQMNWISLGCSLCMVVTVLMLSYYFFDILVWFFIIIFMILCCFSTYACGTLVWTKFFSCCKVCDNYTLNFGPCIKRILFCFDWSNAQSKMYEYNIREIIMSLISISLVVTWCVFRKNYYSILLHLFLAILFCIYFIASVRLTSLKWITMLLCTMLVYDLFMVYITPLFSSKGCSVMVEVATGKHCSQNYTVGPPDGSKEQIPVVFRIPDINFPLLSCYNLSIDLEYPGGMLGFGDILIPGLLVGYNCAFDLCWNVKYHVYYLTAIIGYALGMVATNVALVLMQTAQPALVYLVPFMLIPTHIVALIKKQWWEMWNGKLPGDVESSGAGGESLTESQIESGMGGDGGGQPGSLAVTPENDSVPLTQ